MQCSFPRPVKNGSITLYVPCGQCICCRINKTTEWSLRLMCELRESQNAMFVTLTYSDEYCPKDFSLIKQDLTKFIKRLRRDLAYDGRKIRYFACGEYGEDDSTTSTPFGRPHFHLIIFGMNPDDESDRELITENWPYCEKWLFDKKHYGIGSVNADSIQYVTGYIRKKLLGKSIAEYSDCGLVPPFQVQSQGLGLEGFKKYYEEYNHPTMMKFNGHEIPIPRYFVDKLGLDNSAIVAKMKADEVEYLKYRGYDDESIKRMSCMIGSESTGYVNGIEKEYYDLVTPMLNQNHDNKIKQLSMKRKGKI